MSAALDIGIILYAIAQLADIITTTQGIRRGGEESNGVIAKLMSLPSKPWTIIKWVLAMGAAAYFYTNGIAPGLYLIAAIIGVIAYRNTTVAR